LRVQTDEHVDPSALVSIKSVETKETHALVESECLHVEDLLEANQEQDVHLLIVHANNEPAQWVTGKIKSVKRNVQPFDESNTTRTMPFGAHLSSMSRRGT
jgi:hypothetical protein